MNRRAFLGSLVAGAAGLALDPERLLWVPGAKTIFLPPAPPTLETTIPLVRGDIFTIAGVYAVNPKTQHPLDQLQQFIIASDVSAGDVPVSTLVPRPMADGWYRNVSSFTGRNRVNPVKTGRIVPASVGWTEWAS